MTTMNTHTYKGSSNYPDQAVSSVGYSGLIGIIKLTNFLHMKISNYNITYIYHALHSNNQPNTLLE